MTQTRGRNFKSRRPPSLLKLLFFMYAILLRK
jgi:hypothetical protein